MVAELEFLAEHGAHLRQTLIMLEGEDGAFRLIGQAVVTAGDGISRLIAAVCSTNSDREYLLVYDPNRGDTPLCWHRATKVELNTLTDASPALTPDVLATVLHEARASEVA